MKKILLFFVLCFSVSIFADDIIITKKSEKISAVILEINVDNVRFKKSDNPTGPIYTLLKSEIASILYANGSVEVFDESMERDKMNNEVSQSLISYSNRSFYKGTYPISREEYLELVKITCPPAYEQYIKGTEARNIGLALWISGIVIGIGGELPLLLTGNYIEAGVVGTISFAFTVVGIPLHVAGNSNRKKSVVTYNLNCIAKQSDVRLDLTSSSNGIGLALNF